MGDIWTAQACRAKHSEKKWAEHKSALAPLMVGDTVMLHNQSGNHHLRWDKRGTVMKCEGFDQYQLIDGSRRLAEQKEPETPFAP
jgi:hypothetical protein